MSETEQIQFGFEDRSGGNQVEGMKFRPIKGYPMLHWRGKRPFTSTVYYPAQLKETYGEAVETPDGDLWRNKLYWGDNLQVMSHLLKEFRGKVQLVYIDPPFDSRADYKLQISLKGRETTNDRNGFEEKQYQDIWTNDEYLQFMYERLVLIRELLADSGSVYVHCDWRVSGHLRLLLDEVFGAENFVNEIIWWYEGPQAPSPLKFASKHDTIYRYAKNILRNRAYELVAMEEEPFDSSKYEMDEAGRYFYTIPKGDYSDESIRRLDADGRVYWTGKGTARIKKFVDVSPDGRKMLKPKKIPDVWRITSLGLAAGSKENLAYPTQKPVALLERIVRASSKNDDIVADFFCGSGTTQAVAMKMGRRFIGADINYGAIQITTRRLLGSVGEAVRKQPSLGLLALSPTVNEDDEEMESSSVTPHSTTLYTGFEVYNVNNYDVFRNPVEAKDLIIRALELQPLPQGQVFDGERDGRLWRIMPVNRVATRADLNELINNFNYQKLQQAAARSPGEVVERITLVCMGHDPDLKAHLEKEIAPIKLDIQVLDLLRDRQDLQFKRDAEARVVVKDGSLVIEAFYPLNLLQKLSLQKEEAQEWRELVESVMVDWNYDGAVLHPAVTDIPEGNGFVVGRYPVPDDAGTIRVKITDLLSESWEGEVPYG